MCTTNSRKAFLNNIITISLMAAFNPAFICAQQITSTPSSKNTFDGLTPKGLEPGSPAGSYALSGFDTVNLYSGRVNVVLPLLSVGGRGEAGYTINLPLNFSWNVRTDDDPNSPGNTLFGFDDAYWSNVKYHYRPVTLTPRRTGQTVNVGVCPPGIQPSDRFVLTLTRLSLRWADGSEVELRDNSALGGGLSSNNVDCSNALNGVNRGKVWTAADGSGTTFISNVEMKDSTAAPGGIGFYPDGVLYTRNGVQYHITKGLVTKIRDRNGNITTFQDGTGDDFTITDSLGRTIQVQRNLTWTCEAQGGTLDNPTPPTPPSCIGGDLSATYDQITFPGNGGSRTLKVYWRASKYDLACTRQTPIPSSCAPASVFQLFGIGFGFPYAKRVSKVELPDSRIYKFYYDAYGDVARIELPTGGAYEYDHVDGLTGSNTFNSRPSPLVVFGTGASAQAAIYRRVSKRREYQSTGDAATAWLRQTTYDAVVASSSTTLDDPLPASVTYGCQSSDCVTVTTTEYQGPPIGEGSGTVLAKSKHYFYGDPKGKYSESWQYSNWLEGKEFRTDTISASDVLLHKEVKTWTQRATVSWFTPPSLLLGPEPAVDTRVTRSDRTIEDGKIARTSIAYASDSANNQTDVDEYDFVDTAGATATLIRRTHYDYQTDGYAAVVPSQTAFVNVGSHLRSLVKSKLVCSTLNCTTSTSFFSKSEFYYDQSLVGDQTNPTGHDVVTSINPRGNVTEFKTLTNVDAANFATTVSTKVTYDILGNITSIQDSNGNTTTIAYDDKVGSSCASATTKTFAFPTSVTNPANWTNSACYDYSLGRPVNFKDANNITTALSYQTSGLDRLKTITRAPGSGLDLERKTTFDYGDTPGSLYVRTSSDQFSTDDANLKTEVKYDGFGRKISTIASEDGTFGSSSSIRTDMIYDALWRTKQTSNPYRPGGSPEYTTASYDALGRAKSVQFPDGSTTITDISGATSTVKDEACKSRDIKVDALGRIKEVIEDSVHCAGNSSAPLKYSTTYGYNVLGLLTAVQQGSQQRAFEYDRAGRLANATNPESGKISYTYDLNGNVKTITDARQLVTTKYYDSLDRVSKVDIPNALGSLISNYLCYDGFALQNGVCNGTVQIKGSLTQATSPDSVSNYSTDTLGRITASSQVGSDGTTYSFAYEYNTDGSLRNITYPSSRKVVYTYDKMGRPSKAGLSANASTDYVSSLTYKPHGALDTANLGNGITEIWTYNNRLQAQSITTKNSSNVELLKLTYGYNAQNNGNIATQTIATGAKTYQQSYQYDDLNRLTRVDETTQGASTGAWWTGFGYGRYGNVWFEGPGKPGIGAQNLGQFEETTNRLKQAPDGTALAAGAYDASGNLANHPVIGVMTYDGLNRLVRFENGSTKFSWGYDAEGRRVRRKDESTANGNVITYVFDASGRLAAEVGGNSITTCTRCFLTHDSLGSTRLMTDSGGVVKQRRDFMPFGEEILANATFGNRHQVTDGGVTTYNTVSGPTQQFTGKERDPETGLDYFGARYLSSSQGRFTSPDMFSIVQKAENREEFDSYLTDPKRWNKYAYSVNNPLKYVDPDGNNPVLTQLAQRLSPYADKAAAAAQRYGQQSYIWATQLFNSPIGQQVIQTGAELATGTVMPGSPIAGVSASTGSRIVGALGSLDAAKQMEGKVALSLANGGLLKAFDVTVGGRQIDAIAGKAGEFVVEVTTGGGRGKIAQALGQMKDTGKQVVIYGEDLTKGFVREAQRQGIKVAQNLEELKKIVSGQ